AAKKNCRVNGPSPKLRREKGTWRAIRRNVPLPRLPSLSRKSLRQLGFLRVHESWGNVWPRGVWSRERNRNPTFSDTNLRSRDGGLNQPPLQSNLVQLVSHGSSDAENRHAAGIFKPPWCG